VSALVKVAVSSGAPLAMRAVLDALRLPTALQQTATLRVDGRVVRSDAQLAAAIAARREHGCVVRVHCGVLCGGSSIESGMWVAWEVRGVGVVLMPAARF